MALQLALAPLLQVPLEQRVPQVALCVRQAQEQIPLREHKLLQLLLQGQGQPKQVQ